MHVKSVKVNMDKSTYSGLSWWLSRNITWCSNLSPWVWRPSMVACICNPNAHGRKFCKSMGLAIQPVKPNQWVPASVRDLVLKDKVYFDRQNAWNWPLASTCLCPKSHTNPNLHIPNGTHFYLQLLQGVFDIISGLW